MDKKLAELQLGRLRGAPAIVRWLLLEKGCWVMGSRADFKNDRVRPDSDWDIVVAPSMWQEVAGCIVSSGEMTHTRLGGWRLKTASGVMVDIILSDLGGMLAIPFTYAAWHPQSGQVYTPLTEEDL